MKLTKQRSTPVKQENPKSNPSSPTESQKSVSFSQKPVLSQVSVFPSQGISSNVPKSLSSRIANIFSPTWLSNGYAASSIHLGLRSGNFERTGYLALSLILECTKNYFIYLYFYIEYKKSLEEVIDNKPVDSTALSIALLKFSISIISYVGTGVLSSAFLRKFIDSLATAMKIYLTKIWIEGGTYNGANYLQHEKDEHLEPSLVISRDVSLFVTSTAELLYNYVSNISSTIAAISIFWSVLDTEMLAYCLSILFAIKVLSSFIGASLKNIGHEQKKLEGKHTKVFSKVSNQSESIELCQGGSFETERLTKYLQEALTKSNLISNYAGLIGFTTEVTSFGSFALGIFFCFDKIVSGMLSLEDARTIGISINYIINFVMAYEKNMPLIVRSEVAYTEMQKMDSINNLWYAQIKKRDENFIITKTTDGSFRFEGIVKDPAGNILYSTMGKALKLEKGKRYQISGPSGSGKSTVIRAFAGIWPYVEGENDKKAILDIPEDTCILPQIAYIHGSSTTLLDIIREPKTTKATREEILEIQKLMEKFGLDKKLTALLNISSWQEKDKKTVQARDFFSTLTVGEKQCIAIIKALIQKPPSLLILDEATSSINEDIKNNIDEEIVKRLPNSIILFIKHSNDSSRNVTPQSNRALKKLDVSSKKVTIKECGFGNFSPTLETISEENL